MSNFIKRKKIRISEYDYSQSNLYFVTVCSKDKQCIFGTIKDDKMYKTSLGVLIEESLINIKQHYNNILVDKYVIMPNHIHYIISILENKTANLSNIINQFKGYVSKQSGKSVWQKSFYDHVIRNDSDYLRVWEYIEENVLKWSLDEYYK